MKKKIVIVRPSLGQGGADRVTINILQYLNPEEFSVSLILMQGKGEFMSDIPKHVQWINVRSSNLWFFVFPLTKILRSIRPDISFSTCSGASMPLALAHWVTGSSSRLIVSERGRLMRSTRKINRLIRVIFKYFLYRRADVVTVVSKEIASDVEKWLKIIPSKVKLVSSPLIPTNLDEQMSKPIRHDWFLNNEFPKIVHAGRFVPEKDHRTLIQAFANIPSHFNAKLILLGEGPLRSDMERLVSGLGLSDSVWFVGFDKNPFAYFAKSTMFVLSSISEGMPGVLIQAMSCGVPVISTDCPSGPSEVIDKPMENGILTPMQNVEQLSNAMVMLLKDKELREKLGNQGRQSVGAYFEEAAMKSYLKVLTP